MTQEYKKEYAEFIDLAAHDLDAPLRKLSVLIERLTQKIGPGLDADAQGYVKRINAGIEGMRSMIDALQEYGHLKSAPVELKSHRIENLIEEAWLELRQEVEESGATLHRSGEDFPELVCDTSQIRQLFEQLFDNAIRFRNKDVPPRVEVHVTEVIPAEKRVLNLGEDRAWFQFTVSDNGVGFNEEDGKKIFRPFVQLHGKSAFGGNGIGLALSKQIIDNHEGIIFAKSTENAGTKIIFILPQTIN